MRLKRCLTLLGVAGTLGTIGSVDAERVDSSIPSLDQHQPVAAVSSIGVKAVPRPLFSVQGLTIHSQLGKNVVVGNLTNISGRPLQNVTVVFATFDDNEQPVAMLNVETALLAPNASWEIRAEPTTTLSFSKAKIVRVESQ